MGFGLKNYESSSHVFNGVFLYQLALGSVATMVWVRLAKKYNFFNNASSLRLATPIAACLFVYYSRGICMHYFAAYHNAMDNINKRKQNYFDYVNKDKLL